MTKTYCTPRIIKRKNNKLNLTKIKNFLLIKYAIKKRNRQAVHISQKELYPEYIQNFKKETITKMDKNFSTL